MRVVFRYEGLRYGDFLEVVASLRSSLEKETGPYKLRKANQRYEQWVREAGGSILTRAVHKAADEEDEAMLTTQSSEAEAEEDTNEVPHIHSPRGQLSRLLIKIIAISCHQPTAKANRQSKQLPITTNAYAVAGFQKKNRIEATILRDIDFLQKFLSVLH